MTSIIHNLSKKDKKVARQIIELGLQREFESGLKKASVVLDEWKAKARDNRDSYHLLFKTIRDFDKHIAARYDHMTGSRYGLIVVQQLIDGIIDESELSGFSDEVRQTIVQIAKQLS
jgi:hypothetical protein